MVRLTRRKRARIGHVLRRDPSDIAKKRSILDTRRAKTTGKAYNNLKEVNGKRTQDHTVDLE